MFCPKCGMKNLEGVKYCRACGTDISLVPDAITGQLAKKPADGVPMAEMLDVGSWGNCSLSGRGKRNRQPSLEQAIVRIFIGIAFLLVAPAIGIFAPGGKVWWFWMLIPAFSLLGGGVAEIVRLRQWQRNALQTGQATNNVISSAPPAANFAAPTLQADALPPRNTSEIFNAPPPSITENTTRHLDPESASARYEEIPVKR